MDTKKIVFIIGGLLLVVGLVYVLWGRGFAAQDRCLDAGGSYDKQTGVCDHNTDDIAYEKFDGVVYSGVIDGKQTSLEIIGAGDGYRMSVNGQVTLGQFNTERGFGSDENASTYILNWQQPESQQKKFVKLSKDLSSLVMVGSNGQLDTTATLRAAEGTINPTTGESLIMGNKTTDQVSNPIVGGDKDEHGCIGSAGYTWSTLKKSCVRIFESGFSFDAYGDNTDTTLAAYVIVSDDKKSAEVFLPGKNSVTLVAVKRVEGDVAPILFENKSEKIKIMNTKDMFIINVDGKSIFERDWKENEAFSKLVGY